MASEFSLNFAFANGEPVATGSIRLYPEDFQVTEIFSQPFSGEGEHLCLWVEKIGQNTHWVAKCLAEVFNIPEQAIGYCGLKDRHAVTRQWFSLHLPGQAPVTPGSDMGDGIRLLAVQRHSRKLRRGDHSGNRFQVRIRSVEGDYPLLKQRLEAVRIEGVPNYFGEQRFGIAGQNLAQADALLDLNVHQYKACPSGKKRRNKKRLNDGIYLSAARSYLFNLVLSERVGQGNWNRLLDEETLPQGPLWGRGRSQAGPVVRQIEQQALADYGDWRMGLEYSGLSQQRRNLVVKPEDFAWEYEGNDLLLRFSLPCGAFATSVLRELIFTREEASVST